MSNKHVGTNTSSYFYSKRYEEKLKRKRKAFDKRYKRECGECTSYFATPEEIEKLIGNNKD